MVIESKPAGDLGSPKKSSMDRYTASDAMLDALCEMGVTHLFSNFGSDHPTIIEALAKRAAQKKEALHVVTCPHEIVALSAAHGHAMVSGQGQGVFVHTDVGTANLGGTVHNASRSRVPAFIFAGETPYTLEDELPGSRRGPINYLQNVYDQRGIVREYVKWEYELRTGKNVKQIVYRAMQLAHSDPQGPVYLTGAREVLEEEGSSSRHLPARWNPVVKNDLPDAGVKEIVTALVHAQSPLIVTSYLGRNPEAVSRLVALCEKLALPVLEIPMFYMNFPGNHPLHIGYEDADFISKADVIVVLDSDVPWEPKPGSKPGEACRVFYIDVDPIKQDIPVWYMLADKYYRADCDEALKQLNAYADTLTLDKDRIGERYSRYRNIHVQQREEWEKRAQRPEGNRITAAWLSVCIRNVIDDEAVIINETVTSQPLVRKLISRNKPGTYYTNCGSSLGWSGGAAIGAKLAKPEKTVVCLTGDGSYMFSVPSSVHYVARRYQTPFLTVIYNNQGWNATKINVLSLYPDGAAKQDDRLYVNFDQPSDLSKIAEAAGGAYAQLVEKADEVPAALRRGLEEVKRGRSAVIDVRLVNISNQKD